jgi:hypothetical protein
MNYKSQRFIGSYYKVKKHTTVKQAIKKDDLAVVEEEEDEEIIESINELFGIVSC